MAQVLNASTHGGKTRQPLREEGSFHHRPYILLPTSLTPVFFDKIASHIKTAANLKAKEAEYAQLQKQLARVGYLSKGSVVKRAPGKPGSRYQWTTKVKARTVSLTLSAKQYHRLKEVVTSQRKLERLLEKMHRISRKIMCLKFPNQTRRNQLTQRVYVLFKRHSGLTPTCRRPSQ